MYFSFVKNADRVGRCARGEKVGDFEISENRSTGSAQVIGVGLRNARELDDSCVRRVQSFQCLRNTFYS